MVRRYHDVGGVNCGRLLHQLYDRLESTVTSIRQLRLCSELITYLIDFVVIHIDDIVGAMPGIGNTTEAEAMASPGFVR